MRRLILVLAATLTLAACATAQKLGAANDVHALLVAIRDNDGQTFDAHVDHDALKKQLQGFLQARISKSKQLKGLADLLGPSVVDFADEALIQPKTFRLVAEQYGYKSDTKIPNPLVIAQALKQLPDGRVCATKNKDGPCVLVFTKEQGVWKLSSFEGDFSMLRIKLGRL
jgi:predicted small secreted protein